MGFERNLARSRLLTKCGGKPVMDARFFEKLLPFQAASVASMQRSGIEGPRITPMPVSATRSMAAGDGSWQRRGSRFAAAIAMRGLLSGWVSCVSPLALQRYAFKPLSKFRLAFGVFRLDEWSTSRARNS